MTFEYGAFNLNYLPNLCQNRKILPWIYKNAVLGTCHQSKLGEDGFQQDSNKQASHGLTSYYHKFIKTMEETLHLFCEKFWKIIILHSPKKRVMVQEQVPASGYYKPIHYWMWYL